MAANGTIQIGPAPLIQAFLMEDVIADRFPEPFIFSHFQKAHRTALIMHPVPAAVAQLVARHEITKMADIVLGGSPWPAEAASAPLDDEDGDGDDENGEEDASDYEQKFHEQVPEIDSVDLKLKRKCHLALLRQFDADDETLSQSVGLPLEEQQGSGELETSLLYLPFFSTGNGVASIEDVNIPLVLPNIDCLEVAAGGGVADLEDENHVGVHFLRNREKSVIQVIGNCLYLRPVPHLEGRLRAVPHKTGIACAIIVAHAVRVNRTEVVLD